MLGLLSDVAPINYLLKVIIYIYSIATEMLNSGFL